MYSEQPAAGLLGQSVECSWQYSGGTGTHAVAPDGCVDIIYSYESGLSLVGAMTIERVFATVEQTPVVGIRLRPGMARLLLQYSGPSLSAADLTDAIVPLEQIWGRTAREARQRLDDQPSASTRTDLLKTFLRPVEIKNAVQRALEYMAARDGAVDLNWIASQSSLSPRQFRRRCLEESGLTPKRLCRILRFRRARALALAARRPDWADIAILTGYCDQAHLIRDFREFTNRTPMTVLSNR